MQTTTKKYLKLSLLLFSAIAIIYYFGLKKYINISYIKSHQVTIQEFVDAHYTLAMLVYCCLYASFILLMVPFTLVLITVAGFFFGTFPTIIVTVLSALIGSGTFFLAVRYLFRNWLESNYQHVMEVFKQKFDTYGASYIIALHFLPLTPFALINIMAALSNISLITFLWTTAIGILPTTCICAFAGQHLATIHSIDDITSPTTVLLFLLLTAVALSPIVVNWLRNRTK